MFLFDYKLVRCWGLSLLVAGSLAVPVTWGDSEEFSAGPLFDSFPLTLKPGERLEAAGPLFSREHSGTKLQTALSPLFCYTDDPEMESKQLEVAYPMLTYNRIGGEYRFQLFQLFSFAGGRSQDAIPSERFTLFPIYFQQRSPDPTQNYTALLPFYGTFRSRLMRDEFHFVMMPLYLQTRKRDVVTDNYLFPLFHLRHGDQLQGWQFWPLAGYEHKGVTSKTNSVGDLEIVGGHEKRMALWPFYYDQRTGLGTDNPVHQVAVLPFYVQERSPQRDYTAYLWPLFAYADDRGKGYRQWSLPWPVAAFARGEGKTGDRLWPFYSHMHTPTIDDRYYLWPLYKRHRIDAPPLERERLRLLTYVYQDLINRDTRTGAYSRQTEVWPLFTSYRDPQGNRRFQLFAPVEPVIHRNAKVERNWAPLWSLWRAESNVQTGAASQSLLWNLYRGESTPTTKKRSFLFGLFQYQSTPEGRRWRVFYIPLHRSATTRVPESRAHP